MKQFDVTLTRRYSITIAADSKEKACRAVEWLWTESTKDNTVEQFGTPHPDDDFSVKFVDSEMLENDAHVNYQMATEVEVENE